MTNTLFRRDNNLEKIVNILTFILVSEINNSRYYMKTLIKPSMHQRQLTIFYSKNREHTIQYQTIAINAETKIEMIQE